jgi:ATP-dependent RNA helicase DDX10/DBP4
MFERKNQNILSEHYSKLVDHGDAADEDEDFITLKRADHDLDPHLSNEEEVDPHVENLSKRKLKLSRTKRTVAEIGQLGQKLIFDDDGNPHEMYEMVNPDEFYKHGTEAVREAGRTFAEGEKGKLKNADVQDKQKAKEKRNEKKRKRKERKRGVSESAIVQHAFRPNSPYLKMDKDTDEVRAIVGSPSDRDDGYVSPDFGLPSEDENEDDVVLPPPKRTKSSAKLRSGRAVELGSIEDEEEMALRLLRKK